uniref:Claudin n=1 Tax=Kryptolebias marmoratus TaxID=37003 RepID=A0A3Q3F3W8_KRYMA
MSMGLEIVGIAFGVIGFITAIVTCALPMWRVTAFIGANIITAQVIWEGLWMSCVTQSTGQMQCKMYDSMLALSQDLQAARAMTVISIILGILGVLISIVGAKCTNCIEEEAAKAKVMIISGIFFILAGILVLIPVCWSAHTIIRDFYNPTVINMLVHPCKIFILTTFCPFEMTHLLVLLCENNHFHVCVWIK